MEKDYRKGQKVIATLQLEDKGQDFIEIDILENGVILGNSPIFSKGRISIIGIGTIDGKKYFDFKQIKELKKKNKLFGMPTDRFYIYKKETGEQNPLPWEAKLLNYEIVDITKAKKPNRFIMANK